MLEAINLDNAYCLERRVRDELRKKNALREEVLQVRKEREQVALRMDEIRLKHEREKTDAQVGVENAKQLSCTNFQTEPRYSKCRRS